MYEKNMQGLRTGVEEFVGDMDFDEFIRDKKL